MDEDLNVFVPLTCVDSKFIGKYEINKLGQVRIISTKKILSVLIKNVDYPKVILRASGYVRQNYFVHVLVAKTFIHNPDPINKTQVNHKNLDRFDYSISNLEWCTPSENLQSRGELNSWNRLVYVMLDEEGNELERFPRKDLSKEQRDRISSAIPAGLKYKGHHWKIVDTDVEKYYARFSAKERKKEEWREAIGHPGIYVSNLGLVKTSRGVTVGHLLDSGYRSVNLKPHKRVHTLVAETFLAGRELVKPEVVDHINCDKEFNAVWNLKVCKDQKENLANLNTRDRGRQLRVGKYDLKGNLVKEYNSILEATTELGLSIHNSNISSCCKEKRLKTCGFFWAYLDGTESDVISRKVAKYNKKRSK